MRNYRDKAGEKCIEGSSRTPRENKHKALHNPKESTRLGVYIQVYIRQQLIGLYFYMCVSSFQISLSMLDVTSSDTGRTRNLPAEGITGNCAFSLPEGGFYPQLTKCPQTFSFLIAPPLGVSQVLKIIFRPSVFKLLEGLKSRCSLISHQSFTHRSQLASTAALPLWTPDLF